MCGRFTLVSPFVAVAEAFHASPPVAEGVPRFNISPGEDVLCVVRKEKNALQWLHWGLIPFWAKGPVTGIINARSESVAEKATFRDAFVKRRCLIAADGFFEWRREKGRKQPFYFRLISGAPFGFAGVYEPWTKPDGAQALTCTILTTEANREVSPVHDRMPVILRDGEADAWLNTRESREGLLSLLRPLPGNTLEGYAVNPVVNNTRNDSPDCIKPFGSKR